MGGISGLVVVFSQDRNTMNFSVLFVAVIIKKPNDFIFIVIPAKNLPGDLIASVAGANQQKFLSILCTLYWFVNNV